jgi:hypothetical protein
MNKYELTLLAMRGFAMKLSYCDNSQGTVRPRFAKACQLQAVILGMEGHCRKILNASGRGPKAGLINLLAAMT